MRKPSPDTNRLSQSNCAAASNADHRVRFLFLCIGQRFVGDVCRCVHGCFGEDTSNFAIEKASELLSLLDLLWGREKEWCGELLTCDFVRELGERALTEDDARRRGVVFEGVHDDDECCAVSGDCNSCVAIERVGPFLAFLMVEEGQSRVGGGIGMIVGLGADPRTKRPARTHVVGPVRHLSITAFSNETFQAMEVCPLHKK